MEDDKKKDPDSYMLFRHDGFAAAELGKCKATDKATQENGDEDDY